MTMATWCSRKMVKGTRASRTTGKQKGIIPSQLQKWMCKHNRSHKHSQYTEVMQSVGKRKTGSKS